MQIHDVVGLRRLGLRSPDPIHVDPGVDFQAVLPGALDHVGQGVEVGSCPDTRRARLVLGVVVSVADHTHLADQGVHVTLLCPSHGFINLSRTEQTGPPVVHPESPELGARSLCASGKQDEQYER